MSFQTSCVSAANIVTGLTFQQDVVADADFVVQIGCFCSIYRAGFVVLFHQNQQAQYNTAGGGKQPPARLDPVPEKRSPRAVWPGGLFQNKTFLCGRYFYASHPVS